MIRAELKRILWFQKGILIILIMCAAVALYYYIKNESKITEEQYQQLSEFYIEFEGEITEEKRDAINKGFEQYYGKPCDEAYLYQNVKNNTEDRTYLVYDYGWNSLISFGYPDYPLWVAVIILGTLIFTYDAGHKVQNIHNTSYNGRRKLVLSRTIVWCLLSLVLVFVNGLTEFLMAKIFVGLRCFDGPIQAALAFTDCTMNITLLEGVLLANLIKFIGVVMIGLFMGVIATLIRNMYITIIASTVVTFEKYFLSALFDRPYLMPLRLLMPYQAINTNNVAKVIAVGLIIIVLLLVGIIIINNEKSRRRLV